MFTFSAVCIRMLHFIFQKNKKQIFQIFSRSSRLAVLEKNLENVRSANSQVSIENLRLTDWLAKSMNEYYLYEGYLMIFNCEIPVIWIDIEGTITIQHQLVNF